MFGVDPRSIVLFRIALGAVTLHNILARTYELCEHFSDDGVLPRNVQFEQGFLPHFLHGAYYLFGSCSGVTAVWTSHIAACLMLMVGFRPQLACAWSWLCITSSMVRNPWVHDGGDQYLKQITFWAMFLPLGQFGSLDVLMRPDCAAPPRVVDAFCNGARVQEARTKAVAGLQATAGDGTAAGVEALASADEEAAAARGDAAALGIAAAAHDGTLESATAAAAPPKPAELYLSWASVALYLQVCNIYFSATVEKYGPMWIESLDATYIALSLDDFATSLGIALRQNADFCRFLTLATLFMEAFTGPILIFGTRRLQGSGVLLVLAFHGGLIFTMSLGTFPLTCIAACLFAVPTCFWTWLAKIPCRSATAARSAWLPLTWLPSSWRAKALFMYARHCSCPDAREKDVRGAGIRINFLSDQPPLGDDSALRTGLLVQLQDGRIVGGVAAYIALLEASPLLFPLGYVLATIVAPRAAGPKSGGADTCESRLDDASEQRTMATQAATERTVVAQAATAVGSGVGSAVQDRRVEAGKSLTHCLRRAGRVEDARRVAAATLGLLGVTEDAQKVVAVQLDDAAPRYSLCSVLARRVLAAAKGLFLAVCVVWTLIQTANRLSTKPHPFIRIPHTGLNVDQEYLWFFDGILHLHQSWGMFAPNPAGWAGWIVIQGFREDGSVVDLWENNFHGPPPQPADEWSNTLRVKAMHERPKRPLMQLYSTVKWHKYWRNLLDQSDSATQLGNTGAWLCRRNPDVKFLTIVAHRFLNTAPYYRSRTYPLLKWHTLCKSEFEAEYSHVVNSMYGHFVGSEPDKFEESDLDHAWDPWKG